jgi:phosphatidate cytidylyltransferase
MDSNLVRRVGFAAVAIPVALGVVWLGGWLLVALLAIIGVLGTREVFDFSRRQGVRGSPGLALASAAGFAPLAYLVLTGTDAGRLIGSWWPYAAALWVLVMLTWALAARQPTDRPLEAVAITLFAPIYAAGLPAFLLVLRHGAHPMRSWAGTWLVFFPLVVTWICDTAAMFGGRAMKGPKLAPTVSPGKTRSGSAAGVVGGLVVAAVFGLAVFPRLGVQATLGSLLLMALVWSTLGQVGDLAESLFKREVGVKDSSALIPGHGGVLDRFDSLYFVVPLAAALYRFFGLV